MRKVVEAKPRYTTWTKVKAVVGKDSYGWHRPFMRIAAKGITGYDLTDRQRDRYLIRLGLYSRRPTGLCRVLARGVGERAQVLFAQKIEKDTGALAVAAQFRRERDTGTGKSTADKAVEYVFWVRETVANLILDGKITSEGAQLALIGIFAKKLIDGHKNSNLESEWKKLLDDNIHVKESFKRKVSSMRIRHWATQREKKL